MDIKYTFVLLCHILSTALIVKFINFIFFYFPIWTCSSFSTYILWICFAVISFSYTRERFLSDKIDVKNRAVFITGCDSGFGNALAKRLDSKGFTVFSTCLYPNGIGATELKNSCSDRLHVLYMDVTKDESVKKAADYVKENLGSNMFWAIVNNAGIIKGFSVEFSTMEDFRDCMEVNLMGCVRVTKAFLPLLKQTQGRIVNITSAAGEISLPYITPYTASKFAAVGFTDSLRQEVDRWGISVVSIQPELFQTGLTAPDVINKCLDDKLKSMGGSFKEDCGDNYAESFTCFTNAFLAFSCPKISLVVDDLESAVTLVRPYHTYKPRRNLFARFICFCVEVMPRSCYLLIIKLVFFIFFSESKVIKNIKKKIVSLI